MNRLWTFLAWALIVCVGIADTCRRRFRRTLDRLSIRLVVGICRLFRRFTKI